MNSFLFFFTVVASCSLSAVNSWSASPLPRWSLKHSLTIVHESVAIDGIVPIAGETEPDSHDVDHLTRKMMIHNNLEQDIVTPFDIARRKVSDVMEQSFRPENFSKEKLFNALLLMASFGFAGYTILNIDSGMTRGWTQNEIAMRIPLDNWNNYETSLAEKPIYTKTMINVIIYLLGDWLSQTIFQKKNILDFDAGRTLRNGFIGLCFGPLVHEYYQFSDTILPLNSPNPLLTRVEKIVMDQTIYLSVKASIYVAAVALLAGESVETAKTNVKERIVGIVTTAWKFWPLVHCLTYTVVPAQHRILWVNCVDLFWNAILASMTGAKSSKNNTEDTVQLEDVMQTNDLSSAMLLKQELILVNTEDSLFFVNATGTVLATPTLLSTNKTVEVIHGEGG